MSSALSLLSDDETATLEKHFRARFGFTAGTGTVHVDWSSYALCLPWLQDPVQQWFPAP